MGRRKVARSRASLTKDASKKLTRSFGQLWRDSVREFVLAFMAQATSKASGPYAPYIDSGMSLASIIPLASASEEGFRIGLGRFVRDAIRVNKAIAKQAFPKMGREQHPTAADRGAAPSGAALTEGIQQGLQAYELKFGTPGSLQYMFSFKLIVPQMILHQDFFADAVQEGRRAFSLYLRRNLKKYIRPSDLKKIILGG